MCFGPPYVVYPSTRALRGVQGRYSCLLRVTYAGGAAAFRDVGHSECDSSRVAPDSSLGGVAGAILPLQQLFHVSSE